MMKRTLFALCTLAFMLCGCTKSELDRKLEGVLTQATQMYKSKAVLVESGAEAYPYAFSEGVMLPAEGENVWSSGYFPGSLWLLAKWNDDDELRETANVLTARLDDKVLTNNVYEMAAVVNAAHYNAYLQMPTNRVREALHETGRFFSNGYSIIFRTMQNFDEDPEWYHRVAIWNFPVQEFLFDFGRGTSSVLHAKHMIANQVREDGALYEGQIYDRLNSETKIPFSLHGMNDTSAWSRGQAYALYGFTMMSRKSGDAELLQQAQKCAQYIIEHLPEDGIPNWDFDSTDLQKDSMAAAIMASAFVDLYQQTQNQEYLAVAERQLTALSSEEYLASESECGGLLLKHGVGNRMRGKEVDAAFACGDYYFIEAMVRYLAQ